MIRVLIGLIMIMWLGGEAVSTATQERASHPRRHVVEIRGFSFQPPRTVVSLGDTVVWINHDLVPHTVTAVGGGWRSDVLEEGESWEMVIEATAEESYFCEFHPHMRGRLTVRETQIGVFKR